MQHGRPDTNPPRLAIGYGAATTRAVLVVHGAATTLRLDGDEEMSTAVHVSDAGILIGAAAWRRAATDPDGMVRSPLRAGTGRVTVADRDVEVAELAAATLRHVASQARLAAGEPIEDVRLVVPAGWGPRRRTWLRHAARTAGLTAARLIETPVAVVAHAGDDGSPPAGSWALVIDVGAGCEVTVVCHGPAGPEVFSTLADPDAGGDHLDDALVQTLTGEPCDRLDARHRWALLPEIRTARHALSEQVAVTVPGHGGPPVVLSAAHVAEAAEPVFRRVAELARQALDNADLDGRQPIGAYLVGGVAVTPDAADRIAAGLGLPVTVVQPPRLAALLAALDADPATGGPVGPALRLPPWRRLAGLVLPGLLSLALYAHFVLSAEYNNGTPQYPGVGYYVLASGGELATAAVLAAIALLQAAVLLSPLLHHRRHPGRQPDDDGTAGGIALAVAAALATASMYAITAAVFFNEPVTHRMRWALLPVLPTAAAAVVVAALARRRPTAPPGGWDALLTSPAAAATVIGAVGVGAVALWWRGDLPWWLDGWATSLRLAGGLLGIAVACTLVRHPGARAALSVPIGFFTTIVSRTGPDALAIIWALAFACRWTWNAWALTRLPPTEPARPRTAASAPTTPVPGA